MSYLLALHGQTPILVPARCTEGDPVAKLVDQVNALVSVIDDITAVYITIRELPAGLDDPTSTPLGELVRTSTVLQRNVIPKLDTILVVVDNLSRQTSSLRAGSQLSSSSVRDAGTKRPLSDISYPPSKAAKLEHLHKRQKRNDARTIYNCRPHAGPHVEFFVPAFYEFIKTVREASRPVSDLQLHFAHKLIEAGLCIYPNKSERVNALRPSLANLVGGVWHRTYYDSSLGLKPDASTCLEINSQSPFSNYTLVLPFLGEVKNEVGTGDSDPEHQVAMDYELMSRWTQLTEFKKRSCLPSFLFAMAGQRIVISGAIHLHGPVIQRLWEFNLDGHPYTFDAHDAAVHLARALTALRVGIAELETFYRSIPDSVPLPPPFIGPDFAIDGLQIEYTGQFDTKKPRNSRMIYFADVTKDGVTYSAAVKFTPRYCIEAHKTMLEQGLAADLIFHLHDPVTNWHVVITERLSDPQKSLSSDAVAALREGLRAYHDAGFVFGDLRWPNVLLGDDGRPKLIDFDWAGRKDEVVYPIYLNTELQWAAGVKPNAKITAAHDMEMLEKLLPPLPTSSSSPVP